MAPALASCRHRPAVMDAIPPSRSFRPVTFVVALLLFGLGALSEGIWPGIPSVSAAESTPDIWVVSTRRLPSICRMPTSANVRVERFDGSSCWRPAEMASLLAEPTRPLLLFLHGNRYEHADARSQGLLLARRIADCCPNAPPMRTIVYSWPSEQQGILLKDGRAKYERAHSEGHYLAWLLGQIDPERPVSIVGYSYGALITLESFEDLIAAERQGRSDVQPWSRRPGQTNLIFVAPAVRCDGLAPRGPYSETTTIFDRFTLIINSDDQALRFFHLLDRDAPAASLGFVGMPRRWLPADVEFKATDAASIVGRNHSLPLYLDSDTLVRRICRAAAEGFSPAAE